MRAKKKKILKNYESCEPYCFEFYNFCYCDITVPTEADSNK